MSLSHTVQGATERYLRCVNISHNYIVHRGATYEALIVCAGPEAMAGESKGQAFFLCSTDPWVCRLHQRCAVCQCLYGTSVFNNCGYITMSDIAGLRLPWFRIGLVVLSPGFPRSKSKDKKWVGPRWAIARGTTPAVVTQTLQRRHHHTTTAHRQATGRCACAMMLHNAHSLPVTSALRGLLRAAALALTAALLLSAVCPVPNAPAVAGEQPTLRAAWPLLGAAAQPWYNDQLYDFNAIQYTLYLLNATPVDAAAARLAYVLQLQLPAPDAAITTQFQQSANLTSHGARYCASLHSTLSLMDEDMIPALNAGLTSAPRPYGNPSPYGSPTNATQSAYTNGTTSAAPYPPQCRTLQGLLTLWTHAFVVGGMRQGCWRPTYNSTTITLVLAPACSSAMCRAVPVLGQAVAQGLLDLGTRYCGGDLPGEWGQPYGAEAEVLPAVARAGVEANMSGAAAGRRRHSRQLHQRHLRQCCACVEGRLGAGDHEAVTGPRQPNAGDAATMCSDSHHEEWVAGSGSARRLLQNAGRTTYPLGAHAPPVYLFTDPDAAGSMHCGVRMLSLPVFHNTSGSLRRGHTVAGCTTCALVHAMLTLLVPSRAIHAGTASETCTDR